MSQSESSSTLPSHSDVLILGGGLAGLTLALELRQSFPDLSIRVLERRTHPVPRAAHKVGESTVEIGAHYFSNVLGLREHLDSGQVRKFGFRFFFSEGRSRLDDVTELGVSRVLPTPSWQLDRGVLENFLGERARERGISFEDGCTVRAVQLNAGGLHEVRCERGGETRTLRARWLVDASGRAGLLKRQLDLAEDNDHAICAAWFRLDSKLELDAWGDAAWRARCEPPERWRSTNHLCGPGYWAWMIPLAGGAHSVGIVADPAVHPVESFNTFERALEWLHVHQPALAQAVDSGRDKLLDFAFLKRVSYGCKQVFSADRWALTGEAGVFLDPFYSPGSDFIAMGNRYIVELIARDHGALGHGRQASMLATYAEIFQGLYFSFYRNMLSLYRGQYALFGNAEVMPVKVTWDYAYYWGVLCALGIGNRLTDLSLLSELRPRLEAAQRLNLTMQAFFRAWHARSDGRNAPVFLDQQELDWFVRLNANLHDRLDDAQARVRLRENIELLHALAGSIADIAMARHPELDGAPLFEAAGARRRPRLFASMVPEAAFAVP
ncbi:MAG TPA: tryptophan 7-halogenase [Rhodanobacteraceae bacterium]|nr:tryptophan 7-halogenase [Rhodanobacteraceae bacterium]